MPQHKNAEVFSCKICDFKCSKQSNYDKHLSTRKHQGRKNASLKNAENRPFGCKCGKRYKHHQTLNAHIKTCQTTKNSLSESDVIKLLLKENNEFKQLIIEQSSKMLELANKPFNITNNNNCNNKQLQPAGEDTLHGTNTVGKEYSNAGSGFSKSNLGGKNTGS
jgi:hypothetical protein